jgi:transposase
LKPYLRERLAAYPDLTAVRLWREIKERGFPGGCSAVRDGVRDLRPARSAGFEVRFETPPGEQALVEFARFDVELAEEPGVKRIVAVLDGPGLFAADLGPPSSSIRTCKAFCAAISRRSRQSAA